MADVSTRVLACFIVICLIFTSIFALEGDLLDKNVNKFKEYSSRKRRQADNQVPARLGENQVRANVNPALGPLQAAVPERRAFDAGGAGRPNIPFRNNQGVPDLENNRGFGVGNEVPAGANVRPMVLQKKIELPKPLAGGEARQDLKSKLSRPLRIAEVPVCSEDYQRLCRTVSKGNNFAVLECLQNGHEDQQELSLDCNQFLWNYKRNLTTDPRFDQAAFQVCNSDLKSEHLDECNGFTKGEGKLLPCLFDNIESITDTHCRQYLNRMKVITFSDFRLINDFYKDCHEDIQKNKCASVHLGDNEPTHTQGKTIECLQEKTRTLSKVCEKQILRVSELQADDYHTDRQLYFACQGDRERFCKDVAAGEGKIYRCLVDHKKNPHMSDACQEKLTVRQKVVAKDYKADMQLLRKCTNDIKKSNCSGVNSKNSELALSVLLLCIEDWKDDGNVLSGDCEAELFDVRKSLLEDYMVNPEIVSACDKEINLQCKGLRKQGKTLHCLMGYAKKGGISKPCKHELQSLIEETRAGNDYRLDSSLAQSCGKSISILCPKIKSGDARVLSCLMDAIDDAQMDEECSQQLLDLQYFISRDFKLDPVLYKNCAKDVKDLCKMRADDKENPEGLVMACLHRYLHPPKGQSLLSPSCAMQVHRVLRQRAVSVHLNPRIEEKCRTDMGRLCQGIEARGKEMDCLQTNLKELSSECKALVGNFTIEESEDIRMNRILMNACAPMLKKYCQGQLRNQEDDGDALKCLILVKNDEGMDEKCTAGIEHFQIISMTDYRLSFRFKTACRDDVMKVCKNSGNKDKASVLSCLSEQVRNDILDEKDPKVSAECRSELKFEMMEQSEDIKLDPELKSKCDSDIKNLCPKKSNGNAQILNCLREKKEDLTPECHKQIFKKEKEYFEKPDWDYSLMHVCKKMIKAKCSTSSLETILQCLKTHMRDPDFDAPCQDLVGKRLVEQTSDFRLMPALRRACKIDMNKYCSDIRAKAQNSDEELQGQMMSCLKKVLVPYKNLNTNPEKDVKRLSPMCEKYVRLSMLDAALNYKLDPQLRKTCGPIAKQLCATEIEQPGTGMVEECLKEQFRKNAITSRECVNQIARLMQEGLADVHVDPLLYKACSLDLKHFCHGVVRGQGQQMSCLLEALEDSKVRLQPDCKRMLEDRKNLWELAAEVAPPETFNELYLQVMQSPHRNNFLLMFISFTAGMLCFGICCGRATKRISAQVKNK